MWDLVREVKEGYLQDHVALNDFYEGHGCEAKANANNDASASEKYIRYRFPNQIPEGKWLGDMLAVINSDANHPLRPIYQELDDINQYTAPFIMPPTQPFNDDEVKTYVGSTLAIVVGC